VAKKKKGKKREKKSRVGGRERIHHVDQRDVGLIVGEDLGGAPAEGAGEIQVIGDGRVAARGLGHVAGAGATARNYKISNNVQA
jgi:hypothetical protein